MVNDSVQRAVTDLESRLSAIDTTQRAAVTDLKSRLSAIDKDYTLHSIGNIVAAK